MPHYIFNQLQVPYADKDKPLVYLARELRLSPQKFSDFEIRKMSLDSRQKTPKWVFTLEFSCKEKIRHKNVVINSEKESEQGLFLKLSTTVHVVGAGPAGTAAALDLAEKGYKVILMDQGRPVEERFRDIRHFLKGRRFNPKSNILFGEGGAGAFSDGKLTSRTQNLFTRKVLKDWVSAGASPEIAYHSRPHIGTDKLQFIVKAFRQKFIELGGEIKFEHCLEDIDIHDGRIQKIRVNGTWETCETLILAAGHSARDIYRMLHARGVKLEAKPFAVGVRVEHPQEFINRCRSGSKGADVVEEAAEYVLKSPQWEDGPGAYSFCMCPGGVLIPCASEAESLATNGMSYSRRNSPFANSGIVVPRGFVESDNLFEGIEYQDKLERECFRIGGGDYRAPAQTLNSFMENREDAVLPKSSYPCGLTPFNHHHLLDDYILKSLEKSLEFFDRKMPGFIEKGLMVSPETRTSSPLRIVRDPQTLESVSVKGIYPLGEGAGYAGGIISSAADGCRFAHYAAVPGKAV